MSRDDPTVLVYQLAPWITEPGIYEMDDLRYHADPVVGGSVSSTVIRQMTPPTGSPAHARHYLDHGRPPKGYYDVGSAYHARVLGVGDPIVAIPPLKEGEDPPEDWKKPITRALRDKLYRENKIPLLKHEVAQVERMYDSTMRHERIGKIFEPGTFTPEFVVVWEDKPTGLMCRAKIDAVPDYDDVMTVVDLKTKQGRVDRESLMRTLAKYLYHQQFAFYRTGCIDRDLAAVVVPFVVFVEKDAPHVVVGYPIDEEAITWGERQNRAALDMFARCRDAGRWPGYDDLGIVGPDGELESPEPLGVPRWALYQWADAEGRGYYDTTEELF